MFRTFIWVMCRMDIKKIKIKCIFIDINLFQVHTNHKKMDVARGFVQVIFKIFFNKKNNSNN